MRTTLLDTETGETREANDASLFDWEDGNWSCDCNRASYFGPPDDWDDGRVEGTGGGYCKGARRFIVVKATAEKDDAARWDGDLHRLNLDYPEDLLRKHGVLPPMNTDQPETPAPEAANALHRLASLTGMVSAKDDVERVARMAVLAIESLRRDHEALASRLRTAEEENRELRLSQPPAKNTPDFMHIAAGEGQESVPETPAPGDDLFFKLHEMYEPGYLGVRVGTAPVAVYSIELMVAAVQAAESLGREMALRHVQAVIEGATKELGVKAPVFVDDAEFVLRQKQAGDGPKIQLPN